MHKNELIQLHTLLCQIKSYLEDEGAAGSVFEDYDKMGVAPTHVHRSKTDHKRAIFLLGKDLASMLSNDEFSGPARVSNRFEQMATRLEKAQLATTHH